jgi:hypothetical protein
MNRQVARRFVVGIEVERDQTPTHVNVQDVWNVGFSVDANDDKYAERSSDDRHIYTEWITHIERSKFTACDLEFDSECFFLQL